MAFWPSRYSAKILSAAGVLVGAVAGLAAMSALAPAPAMPAAEVAPFASAAMHRAVYDFRLVAAEPGAGIAGVSGQMYYEQDDACDAVVTEHRFNAEYQYPERGTLQTSSQYSGWEAKDGSRFYFNSDRQEDGELVEQLRGSTEVDDETGAHKVVYVRPDDMTYPLPAGYLFPIAHELKVIERARRGDSFFADTVFDGADADGPVTIATYIGPRATADEIDKIVSAANAVAKKQGKPPVDRRLLPPEAWHVRMAIFPLKDEGEILPAYEMDMILHANTVISRAVVDYRVFKVAQELTGLEPVTTKKCAAPAP